VKGGFGPPRSIWSIRVDVDENKEYLFRNKSKTTNIPSDYHKMIPLEHSFDYLMKVHLEFGHIGSRGLLEHVTEARVGCFPRKLITGFHMFCPKCLSRQKEKGTLKGALKETSDVFGFLQPF
jgi:hypothetical protein